MIFVSYSELAQDIRIWASSLGSYDVVLGVPRSGMIPASMLALAWNCALSTPELYAKGQVMSGGQRDIGKREGRVLIVEDSWNTGRSLKAAQALVPDADAAVVYATPDCPIPHYRVIPMPRVFEWNVFHHFWLQQTCMDIDGVLCVDPTREENDDGPKYQHFLQTAKAKWIPTRKVAHLVTSRLEKYRKETVLWLDAHGVKYGQLHMLDCKDARERRRLNLHARHKGRVAVETQAKLFIESSYRQANEIFHATGIPTLCTDNMVMFS
jgi:uncharacterized HAD superfamily protein